MLILGGLWLIKNFLQIIRDLARRLKNAFSDCAFLPNDFGGVANTRF